MKLSWMAALLICTVVICTIGCYPEQVKEAVETDNGTITVSRLFTDEDGFTVHAFDYRGRTHFYVTPHGRTMTTHSAGRGHVQIDSVDTLASQSETQNTRDPQGRSEGKSESRD